ncbi:hypothetical protein ACTI_74930 [Actinoplanes sp. OR16]|uniref:hypothetical protein n=1 Tax=Actinoplanes sp. OR16 TaxID=946334 RepID=UPI000F7128E3|nr:hypothetical protein [Actinoplanes sp. OR16]BBH70808.1 hypothetical protein ACTI_74930 [Actinoplanes sp. OR16]
MHEISVTPEEFDALVEAVNDGDVPPEGMLRHLLTALEDESPSQAVDKAFMAEAPHTRHIDVRFKIGR